MKNTIGMTEAADLVEPSMLQTVLDLEVQVAVPESLGLPSSQQIFDWANAAFQAALLAGTSVEGVELVIRVVDEVEMQNLNRDYRGKDYATNVLSFPAEIEPLLGDIAICHPVVEQEAQQQQKTLHDHYAHMVVHGVLHLCGFDHVDDAQAIEMESLEVTVLKHCNIDNPY